LVGAPFCICVAGTTCHMWRWGWATSGLVTTVSSSRYAAIPTMPRPTTTLGSVLKPRTNLQQITSSMSFCAKLNATRLILPVLFGWVPVGSCYHSSHRTMRTSHRTMRTSHRTMRTNFALGRVHTTWTRMSTCNANHSHNPCSVVLRSGCQRVQFDRVYVSWASEAAVSAFNSIECTYRGREKQLSARSIR
jgi:hypothetical protein